MACETCLIVHSFLGFIHCGRFRTPVWSINVPTMPCYGVQVNETDELPVYLFTILMKKSWGKNSQKNKRQKLQLFTIEWPDKWLSR